MIERFTVAITPDMRSIFNFHSVECISVAPVDYSNQENSVSVDTFSAKERMKFLTSENLKSNKIYLDNWHCLQPGMCSYTDILSY